MKRSRTLARRVWSGVFVVGGLLSAPMAFAACATPEAKINIDSVVVPDFLPATGGGWRANPVTLNGQPSKPNPQQGGLFQWTFVGSPLGTLTNATTPQVIFNPPDVTSSTQVTLRLTVTVAGCPGMDTEDVTLTVTDADDVVVNRPPHAMAVANPASPTEGTAVLLDGTGSTDPNGDALTYAWTQEGGPSVTLLPTSNPAVVTFVAPNLPTTTTLTFRLTVSDGSLSGSNTTEVNVVWGNDPPVAALACTAEANEGGRVVLDGSGSHDPDDGIASYEWQQLEGLPEVPDVGTWITSVAEFDAPSLGYGDSGLVPFKLTVTDRNGLRSSAQCSVFIHDVTKPIITTPSNVVAEATSPAGANVGAAEGYVVSAMDAVDGALPLVNSSEYFICEPPQDTLFPLDAVSPVLCSARDSAGNEATANFTVEVVDTTAPVITVPESVAVEATGPDGAAATFQVKSFDLVDLEQDAVCSPASGTIFPINSPGPTTTVTCNATDAHDNVAVAKTFTVAVHDTTAPTFDAATIPADIVEEATSADGAAVSFAQPSASDLVDLGNVTVSCSHASPQVFPLGDTPVTCNAVDSRGNSTATANPPRPATFKVTVQDTRAPVFNYTGDITVTAGSDPWAVVDYPLPTATDIVDPEVDVVCSPASGTTFQIGTTTVNCTATDDSGNQAQGSFQVHVIFAWAGFFKPVDMGLTLNSAKAGSAIPLKFSLGSYQGMGIIASGYPKSAPMGCNSNEDPLTETFTAGQSSLQYDASAGQYIYVWKSEKSWAGTCRQIQVKLIDGTTHTANFSFK